MDELAKERYDLAVERIREIREEKTVAEPYLDFFTKTAGFLEEMIRLRDRVEAVEMKKLSLIFWVITVPRHIELNNVFRTPMVIWDSQGDLSK